MCGGVCSGTAGSLPGRACHASLTCLHNAPCWMQVSSMSPSMASPCKKFLPLPALPVSCLEGNVFPVGHVSGRVPSLPPDSLLPALPSLNERSFKAWTLLPAGLDAKEASKECQQERNQWQAGVYPPGRKVRRHKGTACLFLVLSFFSFFFFLTFK